MRHISEILLPGATLNAKILDVNMPEVNRLIELTCKEQERVLKLKKIDYRKLEKMIITI